MAQVTRETKLARFSKISARLQNALFGIEIATVQELLDYPYIKIATIPNIGKKTFEELREFVRELQWFLFQNDYYEDTNYKNSVNDNKVLEKLPNNKNNISTDESSTLHLSSLINKKNRPSLKDLKTLSNSKKISNIKNLDNDFYQVISQNFKFWLIPESSNLSTRAIKLLDELRIVTIADLLKLESWNLRSEHNNIGERTVDEIMNFAKFIFDNQEDVFKNLTKELDEELFLFLSTDYSMLASSNSSYNITLFEYEGFYYKDLKLARLNLSTRAINTLTERGLTHISELLNENKESLEKWDKLGSKTIKEILDLLSNTVRYHQIAQSVLDNIGIELMALEKNYSEELFAITKFLIKRLGYLLRDVPENHRNLTLVLANYILFVDATSNLDLATFRKDSTPFDIKSNLFTKKLLQKPSFIDYLIRSLRIEPLILSLVMDLVSHKSSSVCEKEIFEMAPRYFGETNSWRKAVSQFVSLEEKYLKKEILANGEVGYKLNRPSIYTLVANISDEKHREMLTRRLNGDTFDEIGKTYGISRERVRQIVELEFSHMHNCEQDRYVKLFKLYDISCQDFCDIFEESSVVYNYLDFRFGKGTGNLNDFISDENIPIEARIRAENIVFKNYIKMPDGSRIECSRPNLVLWTIKEYAKDECSYDYFLEKYAQLLEELGLSKNSALTIKTQQRYENNIGGFNCVLWKTGRLLRYYDFDGQDFTELLTTLNLEQYHDVEYSTERFFLDNENLMKRYDIRDKNELHNLLRKIYESKEQDYIRFRRMPTVEFGNVDREQQVYKLLEQLAPISSDDFANFYNAEYGFDIQAIKANYLFGISKYLHDGLYQLDQELLPSRELSILKKSLKKDYYAIDDIKDIYISLFPNGKRENINTLVLKELGFRVYINYVIRNSYQSITDYFKKLVDCKELDISKVPERILLGNINELRMMKSSYHLIEYESKKFVGVKYLDPRGLTEEYLNNWCKRIAKSLEDGEIFTIRSLEQNNKLFKFDNVEFDYYFYESILKESKLFRHISIGNSNFFRVGGTDKFALADIIVYVIQKHEGMTIRELSEYVEEKYLIYIDKYRMAVLARSANLYINKITKQIYTSVARELN